MMNDLTVILPCAGEGKRLGLSYPKELYEIRKDFCLIDFSLSHIKQALKIDAMKDKLKVAVVIKPGKEAVFHHAANFLKEVEVQPCYFNDSYYEWAGSVYSASTFFSDNNLVLLPDSVVELSEMDPYHCNKISLLELMVAHLQKRSVAFGVVPCKEPELLKNLGACYYDNGVITEFQDKPRIRFNRFNGFWGCYGFRALAGKKLYKFLAASIKHKSRSFQRAPFYPPAGFPLFRYTDLGTWDAINLFKKNSSCI